MPGGSMSWTTTTWNAFVEFPWSSVAVHFTRLVPTGKIEGASLVIVTAPQLSLKVGLPRSTLVAEQIPALAFTSKLDGAARRGGVVSTTLTVRVLVAALPLALV